MKYLDSTKNIYQYMFCQKPSAPMLFGIRGVYYNETVSKEMLWDRKQLDRTETGNKKLPS